MLLTSLEPPFPLHVPSLSFGLILLYFTYFYLASLCDNIQPYLGDTVGLVLDHGNKVSHIFLILSAYKSCFHTMLWSTTCAIALSLKNKLHTSIKKYC